MVTDAILIRPKVVPELDPGFRPASLAHRAFKELADRSHQPIRAVIAFEQGDGTVSRHELALLPPQHPLEALNGLVVQRSVKFLLWSRGACRVYWAGPRHLGEGLQHYFRDSIPGRFDAELMGQRIYDTPFEVLQVPRDKLPGPSQETRHLGRHLEGCRIGFDLGGSDKKVAAVIDGASVFSTEVAWDPMTQIDPQWHHDEIMALLRSAARHLPRVDAIGGSAAGVYVRNQVKVASLFRNVPAAAFEEKIKPLFLMLQKAWNDIPFEVVNDGEVTALAGATALKANSVLGIAMGTSQAVGYVASDGTITPWLNELAFAPIDYRPDAPADEWSQDLGCGVQYFSQQAVARLVPKAGIEVEPGTSLPEQLQEVQQLAKRNDERALKIYQTVGTYLGYALAHYTAFYDFEHVLLLGRVMTGPGGDQIIAQAKHVLETEFPARAETVAFHSLDEKQKRHGQAIAAASLPAL